MMGTVPTYVYKCENDHTFEVMQSMADDSLDSCEVCGASAQRVLFAPAVHFKGSGFYTTDYAKKSSGKGANGAGGEGSGDSKGEKKAEKSESKSSDSKSSDSDSGSSSKSDSKASTSKD